MNGTTAINDRIHALEQRLENRRLRLREDADEAKFAVETTARSVQAKARKWLPVAAAAGAGLAALWVTRRSKHAELAQPLFARGPDVAHVNRRGVRWASLLGIASTAYKFATSSQGRLLISGLRKRFTTRRY